MHMRKSLLAVCCTLALSACSESGTTLEPGVDGSYLYVSVPEFYFGTVDVGDTQTQEIEVVNRGGDIYPIHSLAIGGDNVDEFRTDFYDEIELEPAQALKVNVSFTPITAGRKYANLDIDFDTIKQVSEADNQNEQAYYRARELEDQLEYGAARTLYHEYINNEPAVDVNRKKAQAKLPMMRESTVYGGDEGFRTYLDAVNAREEDNLAAAQDKLATIIEQYPDSYIADDALYMQGYIALMDDQNYTLARDTMRELRRSFPDSSYIDSAIYAEGIASQALGEEAEALLLFNTLRDRHAGVSILGMSLPKDNVVSRVWFERANQALKALNAA